ncbi:MAG TPA: alpha/beta hydrolase [Bacteroidales bacterium]|nr:alpha/beta hydrolase [Bacteroidales bacterium]
MKRSLVLFFLMISMMTVYSQDITGEWDGALTIQGKTLRMVFHIRKTDTGYSATMDSPDQGAKGIQMSHATFENGVLTVEMRLAQMKYVGTQDKNNITGTFTQGPLSLPLNLIKNEQAVEVVPTAVVDKNAAYVESPITLETKTGKIYGSLTLPKSFKKGPLALIIAGSGPTDRNCNNPSMTNDAYKKIAYELAERGIASLRYDKRGVAESVAAVENEASLVFYDYVQDAKDWISLARKDKRFNQIVVIGHSEGSMIGILASEKADKFISVAGAGRSIGVVLKEQLSAQPQSVQDEAFPIIDKLTKGEKVEPISQAMTPLFRPSIQPYMISWLKYDPQVELRKLKIPVLLIQGTTDIQVTVEDAKLLSAAKPNAKLLLINQMNHILRTVSGNREANLATYNNASLPLAEGFIKAIGDFILK